MPRRKPAPPRRERSAATAAAEFAARVALTRDWRATTLAGLRKVIRAADPEVVEELKWKKPSNPAGDPVWSHGGILCVGNTLKAAVRLTFPKGAQIPDPAGVFNTRLDSRTVRAVDVFEGATIDAAALTAIVHEAIRLNRRDD